MRIRDYFMRIFKGKQNDIAYESKEQNDIKKMSCRMARQLLGIFPVLFKMCVFIVGTRVG